MQISHKLQRHVNIHYVILKNSTMLQILQSVNICEYNNNFINAWNIDTATKCFFLVHAALFMLSATMQHLSFFCCLGVYLLTQTQKSNHLYNRLHFECYKHIYVYFSIEQLWLFKLKNQSGMLVEIFFYAKKFPDPRLTMFLCLLLQ